MSRFMDDLAWSKLHTVDDIRIIHRIFPDANVETNPKEGNDEGIDYIATQNGKKTFIDVKRRRPGVQILG